MNLNDFLTLIDFIKNTFVSIWNCLNGVVIVSNGSSSLTLLGFFIGSAFLYIILNFLKKLRE